MEAYTLVDFVIHSSNSSVDVYQVNRVLTAALEGCDQGCQFGELYVFSDKTPYADTGKIVIRFVFLDVF